MLFRWYLATNHTSSSISGKSYCLRSWRSYLYKDLFPKLLGNYQFSYPIIICSPNTRQIIFVFFRKITFFSCLFPDFSRRDKPVKEGLCARSFCAEDFLSNTICWYVAFRYQFFAVVAFGFDSCHDTGLI